MGREAETDVQTKRQRQRDPQHGLLVEGTASPLPQRAPADTNVSLDGESHADAGEIS